MDSVILTKFSNHNGTVQLSRLAASFLVTVEPRYGENQVNAHGDQKKAEIDYAYYVHYFTRDK